ncbi:hypothetical protein [Embleya sp. NPDC059259]|uniref:hypothetical protein n=1 Tax=unclassified Embleya TaxID=2699296 RepID=UPI0036934EEA
MRASLQAKALVAAGMLAATIGFAAPASAGTAGVGDNWQTCDGPRTFAPDGATVGTACLAKVGDTLQASTYIDFNGPTPSGWTQCGVLYSLSKHASNGDWVSVGGEYVDCLTAAQAGTAVLRSDAEPLAPGEYRASVGILGVYNGQVLQSQVPLAVTAAVVVS